MSARAAALFDMDRTLIRGHSAKLFARHQRKKGQASSADELRVAFWMLQYSFGVIDAERIAAKALMTYKGKNESWLREECEELWRELLSREVAELGRAAVAAHRARGELCAIVTGATAYAALPLARELGVEVVVATELEVRDGIFTGRLVQPMSYGQGKVTLAERLAARHGLSLERSTFYSDSITDLPLLERVGTPVAINPDFRLRRIAQQRRWRTERW